MSVDNQQMSILQSEQSIFDLEQQRIDEEQQLTSALTSAKEQLAAQIRQWEQTYLLVAPCDGKVTFTKYWQKNQNVNAGEVLVTVVPDGDTQVDENTKAYMLEVEFPENLVTTYGKELTFSQEMTGTAEIITEDLRLLDKFINPIRAVIKK